MDIESAEGERDESLTSSHNGIDEPVALPGDGGLVRIRLDLEYDGSAFAGWARQPGTVRSRAFSKRRWRPSCDCRRSPR